MNYRVMYLWVHGHQRTVKDKVDKCESLEQAIEMASERLLERNYTTEARIYLNGDKIKTMMPSDAMAVKIHGYGIIAQDLPR